RFPGRSTRSSWSAWRKIRRSGPRAPMRCASGSSASRSRSRGISAARGNGGSGICPEPSRPVPEVGSVALGTALPLRASLRHRRRREDDGSRGDRDTALRSVAPSAAQPPSRSGEASKRASPCDRVCGVPTLRQTFQTIVAIVVVLLVVPSAPAQQRRPTAADLESLPFEPRRMVCYRTATPLTIDGKLDEPAWQAVARSEPFIDIDGVQKPRFATRMKMLWDDEYLYVGADLEEPGLWATLTERDSIIFRDHDFEVFIDPDGDT